VLSVVRRGCRRCFRLPKTHIGNTTARRNGLQGQASASPEAEKTEARMEKKAVIMGLARGLRQPLELLGARRLVPVIGRRARRLRHLADHPVQGPTGWTSGHRFFSKSDRGDEWWVS